VVSPASPVCSFGFVHIALELLTSLSSPVHSIKLHNISPHFLCPLSPAKLLVDIVQYSSNSLPLFPDIPTSGEGRQSSLALNSMYFVTRSTSVSTLHGAYPFETFFCLGHFIPSRKTPWMSQASSRLLNRIKFRSFGQDRLRVRQPVNTSVLLNTVQPLTSLP
jgi:hypothetical protein